MSASISKDLFTGDNVYMLKVRGESMIESQIADGDYVVIRKAGAGRQRRKSRGDGR